MRAAAGRLTLAVCAVVPATPVFAACPIELAVYGSRDGVAGIDFTPVDASATITNRFRMIFADAVILDGRVEWSDNTERPYGTLTRNCPSGDVTGDELAACTLWSGVIYTADDKGKVGLLPGQGETAPQSLIFSGLGPELSNNHDAASTPWDVFSLQGCQE